MEYELTDEETQTALRISGNAYVTRPFSMVAIPLDFQRVAKAQRKKLLVHINKSAQGTPHGAFMFMPLEDWKALLKEHEVES